MNTAEGASILVVEDDAISLKLMRDVLEANGYNVATASNGPDALRQASHVAPRLIVMDIGLPGMDGVEVTRLLKADAAVCDIPVVAVTAYAMPGDEERMRSAGCEAYLTKPIRFAEFLSLVTKILAPVEPVAEGQGSDKGRAK